MIDIKNKLKNEENVYGTWCTIPSPEVTDIISNAGLDFIIIDMEHGIMDYKTAQMMSVTAHSNNCSSLIRVPYINESNILKSYEIGSNGIVVPHVKNIKDVNDILKYYKYPPDGNKGYSPYTRASKYHVQEKYLKTSNKNQLLCIIIEDKEGLENIENIVKNKEIDVIYIGTYDLSVSLNCDINDKKVKNELERCVEIIRKHKISAGCLYHNAKELNYFKKIGINFLVYGVDSKIIYENYNKIT